MIKVNIGDGLNPFALKRILLSDGNWYEIDNTKEGLYVDILELGYHYQAHHGEEFRRAEQIGVGFEVRLTSGEILKGPLSSIKAYIELENKKGGEDD